MRFTRNGLQGDRAGRGLPGEEGRADGPRRERRDAGERQRPRGPPEAEARQGAASPREEVSSESECEPMTAVSADAASRREPASHFGVYHERHSPIDSRDGRLHPRRAAQRPRHHQAQHQREPVPAVPAGLRGDPRRTHRRPAPQVPAAARRHLPQGRRPRARRRSRSHPDRQRLRRHPDDPDARVRARGRADRLADAELHPVPHARRDSGGAVRDGAVHRRLAACRSPWPRRGEPDLPRQPELAVAARSFRLRTIVRLAAQVAPAPLVLDEAYADFADGNGLASAVAACRT